MREMEEGSRRVAGFSGGLIKKNRNSTGCLIIKKKADGSGAGGMSSSPAPGQVGDKVYTSRKKRARLIESQLDSSDEDEEPLGLHKRKVTGRGNRVSGSSNSHVFEDKFGGAKDAFFSGNEAGNRNRNMFDVYDFDGYDDLDDVGVKSNFDWLEAQGSGRMFTAMKPAAKTGGRREFEAVPSSRRGAMGDMTSFRSESSSSKKFNRTFGIKSRHPVPALDEKFDNSSSKEAIRLQGKNGVLKLMVKNKKVGGPSTAPNHNAVGRNITSVTRDLNPKDMVTPPPLYPERNVQRHTRNFDRMKQKSRKPVSSGSSEESEDESEESDEPPKRPVTGVVHRAPKREKREDEDNSPQTCPASGSKESKVKRGSGTEKQLLREKIRNMLVGAGWTIDYRRRRNRDYFDAVYINPSGTAYWSIIKAYDALQKQLEEQGASENLSPFNSISGEVLSKLTRQTQKKLEKELKRKKRDDIVSKRKKKAGPGKFVDDERETDSTDSGSEKEKLSSFIKQNGRSLKGRPRDFQDGQQSSRSGNMHEQAEKPSFGSNSQPVHGRKSKKIGRCTLLVRRAEKGMNDEGDGFIPYKGKRTILSWLIDSDVVKLSEKVLYMSRKRSRVLLEGWITRDGIHCGCCSKILTVSKFEIHAASKQRQLFQNIYLCSGNSLLQCQVDAWNSQEEIQCRGFNTIDVDGDDPNDDTCGICGDGGNLICCDGCPSTFHQNCVGVELLPAGDWHCPHCSCKFCGLADGTSGVLQNCSFCEKKFHGSCIQELASISPSSNSPTSLCGRICEELFEQLQKLLGVKHELESGLSWSFIHRTDLDIDPSHRGFAQRVEWNSKLAVALTVMDECFLPIMDRRSGINLIHSVLYNSGSNFNRLNYSGFYTAILERGDEIISVASIRIHGSQLAEMPFIGTRHIYRRQGMCRRLLFAIESALRSLKVEKLIIPAISELMHTWTTIFGFSGLDESHRQELKSLNMLVFPGTDMLQKKIVDQESKGDMSSSSGTDLAKNSDSEGSPSQTDMLESVLIDRKSAKAICLPGTVVSLDQSSHPDLPLDSCDEAEPQIHNKRTQETQSSPLELKEELVKSDSDAKIISLSDPSDYVLKAGESVLDTPMMDDAHGSATCEDSDINGVEESPADSGLGAVAISSAGDPVEQNPSDHIEDAKTCSRLGEGLPTASEPNEASLSDRSNDLLMQDPVRGEFQAEIGSQLVPDSEMDAVPENKSKAGDIDSVVNASGGASFTVVDTCSEGDNIYRPVTEDPMMGLSAEDIFQPYQGEGTDTHRTNIIAAEDPMLVSSSEDVFQPLKEGVGTDTHRTINIIAAEDPTLDSSSQDIFQPPQGGMGKAILETNITAADSDSTPDTEGASTLLLHPYLDPVLDSSFKDTIAPLLGAHENAASEINGKVPADSDYLMNASPVSTSGLDPLSNGTDKSNLGASAEANSQLHVGDENGLPCGSHTAKGSISYSTSLDSSDKSQMEEHLAVAALDANNELQHFSGNEIHRKEEPHHLVESETNCASGSEVCTGSLQGEYDADVARN